LKPSSYNLALDLKQRASFAAEGSDSIRKKSRGQLLPLLLGRLAKAHTWPATVLVGELDAGGA
jgi:hypothetical protein